MLGQITQGFGLEDQNSLYVNFITYYIYIQRCGGLPDVALQVGRL